MIGDGGFRECSRVIWTAALALIAFGGELPEGARLSVRFEPPRAKAGEKTTLEISVTPPPGSVLLALAQPKSLGAPTAIDLESSRFKLAGPLEEPAVEERPVRALDSKKVRFYPRSFGGTVVLRLPMTAPLLWDDGRLELRGAVTLMFADEKSGKLIIAPSVPIAVTLDEDKPPPPKVETPPAVLEAPATQNIDPPKPVDAGPTVEIVAPPEVDVFPPPKQQWFLAGVALGILALTVGPIGVYDQRQWWARWLGWRRLQCWTTAVVGVTLLASASLLPARTAFPVLGGAAAFGAMLFATGGGPGVSSSNFLAAALRAQPLHGLLLCLALLMKAACWDASAGFLAVFMARSFAPAILPNDEEEFDDEGEDFDEAPRRRRSKSRRRVA
jgi:hypothetical protein